MPWALGANPRAGTRKRSPRKLSGEGEALASEEKGRAFPGEGPACAKGMSLTLGLWLRPGAPPDCWGGTWLLICHFLKVVGKDRLSRGVGCLQGTKPPSLPQLQVTPEPPGVDSPHLRVVLGRPGRAGGVSPDGPALRTGAWGRAEVTPAPSCPRDQRDKRDRLKNWGTCEHRADEAEPSWPCGHTHGWKELGSSTREGAGQSLLLPHLGTGAPGSVGRCG